MSAPTIILSAPIDWGKSRHADALRREYGCSSLVDDWEPSQALTPGALHLTNVHPGDLIDWGIDPRLILRQGWPAQPCMQAQRGRVRIDPLLAALVVWVLACVIALGLGASHYLNHRKEIFPTAAPAAAPRVAERPRTLSEAVQLACGPKATGKPVGARDIQCFDLAGRPTFYAVGGQP